ncbi:MAG: MBL fold metallo-hydrolase [Bacteroidetes bacterium]|nr:MBL fold metallo-hydrolase [Bacteroidota bacterium]
MKIQQFYDKALAQASYAILANNEIALIDPERDPQQYYEFAGEHKAKIIAVIETHPHADFISSHLEIAQKTGAKIYISKMVGADYPHTPFDEGKVINIGKVKLKAINTPGHSPDSISIVAEDENGNKKAVFTGDTLFIGDVGRPDLREKAGKMTAKREELAKMMYHSTREKLMQLPDEVLVYPAHGAGSLCGKNLSSDLSSTIGKEKKENYALQPMDEEAFVSLLLEDQPFIPKYFSYNVDVNKKGAESMEESTKSVPRLQKDVKLKEDSLIVDTRPQEKFKKGHLKGAINIMDGAKFETWLGSIIGPDEQFYLVAEDEAVLEALIRRAAKIGYEKNIKGAILNPESATETSPFFDYKQLQENPDEFTIVDIRNVSETRGNKIFEVSIHIPLPELRERANEIPKGKPVAIHCAGGYRSAAGASIVERELKGAEVFDVGEDIKHFQR